MAIDWVNRRSAAKGWAQQALIFLFFAAFLGGYASRAFAPYQDHQFRPAWERARWISAPAPGAVAYFRKVIMVPTLPKKAALQVAATDSFSVYVNGKELGDGALTSARPSGLFDLTPSLVVGRNVIAVRVERKTYPGQPEMIAEGYWRTAGGIRSPWFSDATWRVARVEGNQAQGTIPWHALEFDDSAWERAQEVSRYIADTVYPLSAPPQVIEDFPRGDWIWSSDRANVRGTFLREFHLPPTRIDAGWLGISTQGAYGVSVNGVAVYAAPPTSDYMDLVNIGPYLRPGVNRVMVDVAATQPPGQLAAALLVTAGGETHDFSSDQEWRAAGSVSESVGVTEWTAPSVIGSMLGVGARSIRNIQGVPAVRIVSGDSVTGRFLAYTYRAYPWAFFVLGLAVVLAALFGRAAKSLAPVTGLQATTLFAKPLIVIAAGMAFVFLLTFDVRIDPARLFHPLGVALAVAMVLLWELVILVELRRWGLAQGGQHV
jgi:hypothetical protein